jgi:hypothetical protein
MKRGAKSMIAGASLAGLPVKLRLKPTRTSLWIAVTERFEAKLHW